MRTWARHRPYLAAFLGYVVVFVVGTAIWLAFSARDPVGTLFKGLTNSAIYWLIAVVYVRKTREQARRLSEHGEMRAFIRYPDSLPGSLSGIWNPGIVTPSEGALRFQPTVHEDLEPSGRPTHFCLGDISERWVITGKDRKYLPSAFGCKAITLATDKGRVELAASPESLDLLEGIRPAAGPGL